ncbi:MAG: hypothetical protein RIQ89_2229 [Bacteroidota bacterium]
MIAAALAAIYSTFADSSTYASIAEAKADPSKTFHVVGKLMKDLPQIYDPQTNPNLFSFHIKDNKGESVRVLLNKAKPQDFEQSEQIVVIGKIVNQDFIANDILMKCPSKYSNEEAKAKALQGSM